MNLVLIGLSGTGKSAAGRKLAARWGWEFVDTDVRVVESAGKPIHRIFADHGEQLFRQMEAEAVRGALDGDRRVVAVGGGAPMQEVNREAMRGHVVVLLDAEIDTMLARLAASTAEPRPMLGSDDHRGRLRDLREARHPVYRGLAGVYVSTDGVDVSGAADRIEHAVEEKLGIGWRWNRVSAQGGPARLDIRTSSGSYPVMLGPGLLDEVGETLVAAGLRGRARLISDENVYALFGDRVEESLRRAGVDVSSRAVAPGEASKSLSAAAELYDWLVEVGTERRDLVIALGGGVVGDLAGFVAATYMRGIKYVQLPTSLLAQVDSSVGGKVAIDHPKGKNLIGAFYPPALVIADTATLRTLPRREVSAALAEVAKHGVILDEPFFSLLERDADGVMALEPGIIDPVVARSVEIKARVVERDERESGLRAILNYGHTIGHAVEAITGFERYRHGEAVAIGMVGAATMAIALGLLDRAAAQRQRDLLVRLGLPSTIPALPVSAIVSAMERDKKSSEGRLTWVLPDSIGHVVVRRDVPADLVVETLIQIGARPD